MYNKAVYFCHFLDLPVAVAPVVCTLTVTLVSKVPSNSSTKTVTCG